MTNDLNPSAPVIVTREDSATLRLTHWSVDTIGVSGRDALDAATWLIPWARVEAVYQDETCKAEVAS